MSARKFTHVKYVKIGSPLGNPFLLECEPPALSHPLQPSPTRCPAPTTGRWVSESRTDRITGLERASRLPSHHSSRCTVCPRTYRPSRAGRSGAPRQNPRSASSRTEGAPASHESSQEVGTRRHVRTQPAKEGVVGRGSGCGR